jgi:hypothetical protein
MVVGVLTVGWAVTRGVSAVDRTGRQAKHTIAARLVRRDPMELLGADMSGHGI